MFGSEEGRAIWRWTNAHLYHIDEADGDRYSVNKPPAPLFHRKGGDSGVSKRLLLTRTATRDNLAS